MWPWEHPHYTYVSLLLASAAADKPAATEAKPVCSAVHI